MLHDSQLAVAPDDTESRVIRTLKVMHEWGYAPTLEALSRDLLGGTLPLGDVIQSIEATTDVVVEDGFACLQGHRRLLHESRNRVESHRVLNGAARTIAEEFAREIVRTCPLVDCVALSGSVASGGYAPRDDIDIDLFVKDGAKYLVYALALILGLRTAIRHHRRFGFRKLICINVVWTQAESHPFVRQDQGLAFELLRCKPLLGDEHFRDVVKANPWVDAFFPQIRGLSTSDVNVPEPGSLGKLVQWIGQHERLLHIINRLSRLVTQVAYSVVHWLGRRNASAMERLRFLQRVKYPYEVFQD